MNIKDINKVKGSVKHLFSLLASSEDRIEDSFRCDSLLSCATLFNIPARDMLEEIDSWAIPEHLQNVIEYLDKAFGTTTNAETLAGYIEETSKSPEDVLDVVSEVWPSVEVPQLTGVISRDWTGE